MSILYLVDQGAYVRKSGNRLIVEKGGKTVQWLHSFDLEQVLVFGGIQLSSGAINHFLSEGIDTVFLSTYGRYRGRLVAHFGKNIELRRLQFRKMDNPDYILERARSFVAGKLQNYRILLRRHNRSLSNEDVEGATHRIRVIVGQLSGATTVDEAMGFEGKGSYYYFRGLSKVIRNTEFTFEKRTRRPPRDPMNALLSFGYTLLANTVHSAVNVAGLDPYLGCLHASDYGRPSLVLDLMEEWRPVLVDTVVLRCINRNIITLKDFHFQPEVELPPDGEEREELTKADFPVLLIHNGLKKFIQQYEQQLKEKVFYPRAGARLSYKSIILEQVRLLVRDMKGEECYSSYEMK
jgi:CRISPR-associated protein Cas1